jgi:hypothetical protein
METQKQLAATLFRLTGLAGHTFKLRILRVVDPIPNDDLRAVRLQRWADQLWRSLRCPVFPTSRYGFPGFVAPMKAISHVGVVHTLPDVPDRQYRIEATDQVIDVTPGSSDAVERQLAARIIDRGFTDAFGAQPKLFWRARWNQFFRTVPENHTAADDLVDAFRGLRFSSLFLGDDAYLAADVLTRYLGRKSLAAHTAEEREDRLHDHVSDEVKFEYRALFVRDNGPRKFSCRFAGVTGQTVSEYRLKDLNQTVLEYYAKHYPDLRVEPWDEVVFVIDHGRTDPTAVPASRLFPVFTNEDDGMKSCSVASQMSPAERLAQVRGFLSAVSEVTVDGQKVRVDASPATRPRTLLRPPSLEFGDKQVLRCAGAEGVTDEAFLQWRNNKTTWLYKHGPYSAQALPDIALLFPETMVRENREVFLQLLRDELLALAGHHINVVRQRFYRLGKQAWTGAGLLEEAEALVAQAQGLLLPVVVLSSRFARNVYPQLKSRFASLPSQCVDERTVQRILHDPPRSSRLRNLALGVMTAAGIQPWVLAEPLAHDFYVGIDVLQNQVGYTFFFGTGGRYVQVEFGEYLQRRRMTEAVDPNELRAKLDTGLRSARAVNAPLRSLVVHRDGRWWPKEDQALTSAVTELKRTGVLAPDCRVAVVEIRKSHLPVRLFTKKGAAWENPMPGSFWVLDSSTAVLTTTGKPGVWDHQGRTASALLLQLVHQTGQFSIEDIARDAYWLTHLNWNAPEIEISLPVTIRWNDDSLRYALMQPAEGDDESEGDEAA